MQLLLYDVFLFERLKIHKEEVRDLLDPNQSNKQDIANGNTAKVTSPGKPPIQIRERSNGVITLAGSTERSVKSLKEMADCLEQGSLSRATGSTNMNNQSRLVKQIAFKLPFFHSKKLSILDNMQFKYSDFTGGT